MKFIYPLTQTCSNVCLNIKLRIKNREKVVFKAILKFTCRIREKWNATKKGVKIISNDGQTIGILDRVITDPKNDCVTHLVISSGVLIKKRKLIPVYWMGDVLEDQIHLSVGSRLFGCLIEFRPES